MIKTALITGSTRGIGKQIGLDLLNKGYFVYFNYANNDLEAENLYHKLKINYNNKFMIIRANLSSIYEADKLLWQIKDNLDVLVLNAGITDRTPFGDIQVDKWVEVFNVNLNIPFYIIQKLKNKINSNGKIIFISSISGCTTDSVSISYGVSKGAINILVPYLAKEFAEKKITVNSVVPGYIDTDWHKDKPEEQIKRIEKKCLAHRLGTTEEISKVVLSIIENNFINAQIIRVDGGFGL